MLNSMDRIKIVECARQYLGVPFRHQGRSKLGIDCAGLVLLVGQEMGYLPKKLKIKNYSRMPNGDFVVNLMQEYGEEKEIKEANIGDVFLMNIGGNPQHLSIKTNIGIIHSSEFAKKVIEHILSKSWKENIVKAFSWRIK